MYLAMNTDYHSSLDNPAPRLHMIAEAGFTHVNWCHHWLDDYFYSAGAVKKISASLRKEGLSLLDQHASAGILASVNSRFPPRRKWGTALLKNRIEMCADLGGQAVILHATTEAVRYTLDAVQSLCSARGIMIALENLYHSGHAALLDSLLKSYDPGFIGMCFDTGHGNLSREDPDQVVRFRNRLISLHINDNHGKRDDHIPPFDGTVDWTSFIEHLAVSSYQKPLCLECAVGRSGYRGESEFLEKCFQSAAELDGMWASRRRISSGPDQH